MNAALMEQLDLEDRMVNSDHRAMMNMVGDIVRTLNSKSESGLTRKLCLRRAFVRLDIYIAALFARKEKAAREMNVPFAEHKSAYQYIQVELWHFIKELEALEGEWSEHAAEHYTEFLWDWLIEFFSIDEAV